MGYEPMHPPVAGLSVELNSRSHHIHGKIASGWPYESYSYVFLKYLSSALVNSTNLSNVLRAFPESMD